MNDQEKTAKCMMIPDIITRIPDPKMRFHFCELATVYSSEAMTEKYTSDAERLSASVDVVKSRLTKESLGKKEKRFFETLKEQAREEALNEAISVDVLKPLIRDVVKQLDIEGQERLDAIAVDLHDLRTELADLSNAFDALNAGKSYEGLSRKTVGTQEGIILVPDVVSKPQKFPKIEPKNLHLRDFIPKDWKEKRDVQ